ncbi:DUF5107 domain-containing protein [Photobacterium indicum]|uniref:DUF5107 domain-containing protein n=1 Tax=Photobacterium indicum TaxID=81447 RepID=A0A2T3LEV7_9GAMM|nr:DUF5107 domain-containing protein [Photobacterium indicum]PSV49923.1 DUF5107 domain-containing protein [Photobacterium indicum]
MSTNAKAWVEEIVLPTYPTGKLDPNPLFLENRVYQGSSGSVYPYGVIDSISDVKVEQTYQAVYIENDYIKIMLLPELGGRIHRAYDKVKGRDFVYYNEVVKPALVGLLGPWISGGIEFNWPQHHRPTTYMPTDFTIEHHDDGSVTVWMGEVEHMYGLQIMAGFKVYPNKALIEITGKVYNGNETPRQFLWWSNPAVKGGDDHQSIFPPDVTAVYDHGKRDVSNFPIATGEYYKVDYSPGTDISRYKNLPVPTSYMADKSAYDFVGAYSHDEQGGLLHVANHHVSPGKKQWTWGNCDFGIAWDRQLTDTNGPYIELMTGVFTDNQPDFTWIESHEEKIFVQHFMPYSSLGNVHNANTEVVIKLERTQGAIQWAVYAIAEITDYALVIKDAEDPLFESALTLMPGETREGQFDYIGSDALTMSVVSKDGHTWLEYTEHDHVRDEPAPESATAPAMPQDVDNVEELFFIGQHLQQYHHATRNSVDYYQEALTRDPNHYQSNVAMAALAYERADYHATIAYAEAALVRAHKLNKNPLCGKASYLRGCANEKLGRLEEAFSDVFKSTWSGNCRDTGFYAAARIATKQSRLREALEYVDRTLQLNGTHYQAATLKAYLLTDLNRHTEALQFIDDQSGNQPLGYGLLFQKYQLTQAEGDLHAFKALMNGREANAIHLANFYLSIGAIESAKTLLMYCGSQGAMTYIYQAYLSDSHQEVKDLLSTASKIFADNVLFPNTLTEIAVLEAFPDNDFPQYLLGCFFYAKRDYTRAVRHWEKVLYLNPNYAPVLRNLSVHAHNKCQDINKAIELMSYAFALAPDDARILYELDYLHKAAAISPAERLQILKPHLDIVAKRDDLTAELLNICNITGDLDRAADCLATRQFHPWEGGEGRITGQFVVNKLRLALRLIREQRFQEAIDYLEAALHYPHNLGEGRLVGQTDNDLHYYLGFCHQQLDLHEQATEHFNCAIQGKQDIGQSRYYNDQPADYLFYQAAALHQLGRTDQAIAIYENMIVWAEAECHTPVEVDFFAVSLPALIVFDTDTQAEHIQHCLFVKAMGQLGLALVTQSVSPGSDSKKDFEHILQTLLTQSPAHTKANLFKEVAKHSYAFDLYGQA